jgi:energy-coupling factor transporter transmembrane protein EcfT
LSPWGYLIFSAWASLVAVLLPDRWLLSLLVLEVGFGLIWSRAGLRVLRRPQFWLLVLTTLALAPFLFGEPDVSVGPLHISSEGFAAGVAMSGRAIGLTLALSLGFAALSLSDMVAVFERLGLRGMGFALALAMNMLSTLQEMAVVTLQTIRMRGGLRRPGVALRLFLVTTISNTLRYGDDVVNAAAVRAFDPGGEVSGSLPLRRPDWLLLALIVAWTGVFVALGSLAL